jgi:N-succinyldiaminopimelate aminotransferase
MTDRAAHRLAPFGTTIFSEMTKLAQEHGAVNLAQGFPDFEGPREILDAAKRALDAGENQYARSLGHPKLVAAIAEKYRALHGLEFDPTSEVVVFAGATEGIACALLGLLSPGDEAILFEPFYDSYPPCVALAGATARYCTLRFPDFALRESDLAPLFTTRTRLLLLNSPHNPTGKVFTRAELELIARLCREHDVLVVTDEVYEHVVYAEDGATATPRIVSPIASLPGMGERTLTLSSAGKTFSLTGWKIGWGVGPRHLVAAAQAVQQYVTFAVATPLQVAMADAIGRFQRDYFAQLQRDYTRRRDFLVGVLREVGFDVAAPSGAYFVLADRTRRFPREEFGDDRALARTLVEKFGVAAIPPSVFYAQDREEGRRLLRFAFCKRMETLEKAAERLRRIA